MKSCAVGVSTVGLDDSVPWKLAEYVAAAKAIVTQPLAYEVPGFLEGEHYLTLETPSGLLEQVERLLRKPSERLRIQAANRAFDLTRLRPDRLVFERDRAGTRLLKRLAEIERDSSTCEKRFGAVWSSSSQVERLTVLR